MQTNISDNCSDGSLADTPVRSAASSRLLTPEVALATRIVRNGAASVELQRWLSAPTRTDGKPAHRADAAVADAVAELIHPLMENATSWERKQAINAEHFLAAVLTHVSRQSERMKLCCGSRLLASSLLPLYRSLATDDFHSGFEQTRHRLLETLCVVSLCDEFNTDLVDAFEQSQSKDVSPRRTLGDEVGVELVAIAAMIRLHGAGFDATNGQFDDDSRESLMDIDAAAVESLAKRVPDWSNPDLLWRLSGELIAQKSDLVLPRSWIDAPLPWRNICDHWNRLSLLLASNVRANSDRQPARRIELDKAVEPPVGLGKSEPQRAALQQAGHQESPLFSPPSSSPNANLNRIDREISAVDALVMEFLEADDDDDKLVVQAEPIAALEPETTDEVDASFSAADSRMPRVFIAEVMSHNDPAFVKILQRQIANCRSEGMCISLATISVVPDDQSAQQGLFSKSGSGVCPWQQSLVTALADNPHISDPYAFITADGELLLTMVDIERGEATSVLKDGLQQAFGTCDRESDELETVGAAAKYFGGLATASSPNGSLTPEKLIEAACRCQQAVTRQGNAAIKTIEVF